jgi:hypothetical protein
VLEDVVVVAQKSISELRTFISLTLRHYALKIKIAFF